MRRGWPTVFILAAVTATSGAFARESAIAPAPKKGTAAAAAPRPSRRPATLPALSIGSPTDGKLEGAVLLENSKEIRLRHANGAHYGLPGLVGLLERSAKRLAARFPGLTLHVGDLSRREGGELPGHKSHESGRDADVAFLFVGPDGESVAPAEFLTVVDNGVALENRNYRFDDARNWALVEAWVSDPGSRVEHIFVADPIRRRLLAYARSKGTYLPVLHRAAMAMKQPSAGQVHDDHFHVRISCPAGQRRICVPAPKRAEPVRVKPVAATTPVSIRRTIPASRALVKPKKERETTRR